MLSTVDLVNHCQSCVYYEVQSSSPDIRFTNLIRNAVLFGTTIEEFSILENEFVKDKRKAYLLSFVTQYLLNCFTCLQLAMFASVVRDSSKSPGMPCL